MLGPRLSFECCCRNNCNHKLWMGLKDTYYVYQTHYQFWEHCDLWSTIDFLWFHDSSKFKSYKTRMMKVMQIANADVVFLLLFYLVLNVYRIHSLASDFTPREFLFQIDYGSSSLGLFLLVLLNFQRCHRRKYVNPECIQFVCYELVVFYMFSMWCGIIVTTNHKFP